MPDGFVLQQCEDHEGLTRSPTSRARCLRPLGAGVCLLSDNGSPSSQETRLISNPHSGRSSPRPWLAAAAVAALVVVAAVLFPRIGPSDEPAASVRLPSPPATLNQPSSTPSERPIFHVPATIDATGSRDVTTDLQAFIESVPDGATIRFAAGGDYRVEGTIFMVERRNLEIDGAGSTIRSTTVVDFNRRNLSIVTSTNILVRDLTIQGASTNPGVLDNEHAFEHGIWVDGGADIEIRDLVIQNTLGDCVYLGVGDGFLPWPERVYIHDIICRGAGRNGISIIGGRDIRIEANIIERTGLHAIDIEPNRTDGRDGTDEIRPVQGASTVAISGNTIIGPVEGYFFAANGWGQIDDLTVVDNVLRGTPLRITVQPLPDSGFIRTGIRIERNRSDTPYTGDGAAMRFSLAADLTVHDNVGPLADAGASLIQLREVCRASIVGNAFPGGGSEVVGSEGACPTMSAPAQPSARP